MRRWLVGALVVIAVLQLATFHRTRHDDAYISYRYAENLARGRGMVFNPGERLMGSTAPGHVLVAALVHRIAGHDALPSVMATLGVLAWLSQAVAVAVLLAPVLGKSTAGLVGLLIALGVAGSGRWVALETNLVVAFDLWALVAALRGRLVTAGLLAGLAALTRPDALVFGLLLLLWIALRHRRRAIGAAAALATVLAPWLVFAGSYFGTVLPQSARAKFQVVDLPTYLAHLVRHPAHTLFTGSFGDLGVAAAWLAAAAGAIVVVRRRPELWILPAFFVSHSAAYLYLRPFLAHVWHLYPMALIFAVFVLAALGAALHHSTRSIRVIAAVAFAALTGLVVWGLRGAPESLESSYFSHRHGAYVKISEALRELARPGDSLTTIEVGTLAYYTDLPVIDLGLLVSRVDIAERRLGSSRFVVFDRLHRPWFEEEFRDLPHFLVRAGEFEAYLFDLGQPGN